MDTEAPADPWRGSTYEETREAYEREVWLDHLATISRLPAS